MTCEATLLISNLTLSRMLSDIVDIIGFHNKRRNSQTGRAELRGGGGGGGGGKSDRTIC